MLQLLSKLVLYELKNALPPSHAGDGIRVWASVRDYLDYHLPSQDR